MHSKPFRKGISAVLSVAMLWTLVLMPTLVAAQENYGEICSKAESDAEAYHNSVVFAIGGFFCGIFGFAFAAISTPTVPSERLVGQETEYVNAYTRCYQSKAKSKNIKSACGGWLLGASVSLLIWSLSDSGT